MTCRLEQSPGGCKFGSSCRFQHEGAYRATAPSSAVSPSPVSAPGTSCRNWTKNSTCHFGTTCKFLHPSVDVKQQTFFPLSVSESYLGRADLQASTSSSSSSLATSSASSSRLTTKPKQILVAIDETNAFVGLQKRAFGRGVQFDAKGIDRWLCDDRIAVSKFYVTSEAVPLEKLQSGPDPNLPIWLRRYREMNYSVISQKRIGKERGVDETLLARSSEFSLIFPTPRYRLH